MTTKRDLKSIIRERQHKTGESYTAARVHVMRGRAQRLGIPDEPLAAHPQASHLHATEPPTTTEAQISEPEDLEPETSAASIGQPQVQVEAAVLKIGTMSTARIRILGGDEQITLRSRDVFPLVPGQVITLRIEKQWRYRGDAYASGKIERARVEVGKLGLAPLPLSGGDLVNLRDHYEHVRDPDPYAPLWRRLTAEPRAWYEMDGIAWGAFPESDPDDNPTCEAADLAAAGDRDGARALLMDTLLRDLRCLDAHAHLGNHRFDRTPQRAILHYEIGIRIGELSLPDGFDGVLPWGELYNRPFLRCLHGYALCLWRLGRTEDAIGVFERILALNPNDNQGARFSWDDARQGKTWEQAQAEEDAEEARHVEAVRMARATQARRPGPSVN